MKKSVLASLLVAALASGTAMAQNNPATLPDASGPGMAAPAGAMDDGSTTAGSSLDRSSNGMSGDTGTAGVQGASSMDNGSSSSMGSAQGGAMTQDSGSASSSTMSSGSESSTTGMGTTTTFDNGNSLGAAGRSYDGSTQSGPASRSDVTADRDRALRSDRWVFNDADGVQRLEPGWNSHAGRVYKGSSDSNY